MKKGLVVLFSICLLLNGCGDMEQNSTSLGSITEGTTSIPQTESQPSVSGEENRINLSVDEVSKRMKKYIDDSIEKGAPLVLSNYGIYEPDNLKKTMCDYKMQIYSTYSYSNGFQSIVLDMTSDYNDEKLTGDVLVSYKIYNSKGDSYIKKSNKFEMGNGASVFMDELANIQKDADMSLFSQYDGVYEKLQKIFNNDDKIKIDVKYQSSGKRTYTLNNYQIKVFRIMLDYYREGLTYIE